MAYCCPCMPQDLPNITDCPVCMSLCLGPTILPCGHLLCRKCLRRTLEVRGHKPSCPTCGHCLPTVQGQSFSELANQMGQDLILEDLITEQLACQGQIPCLACPDKPATRMCLDCAEMYCEACSNSHLKMRVSKDHVQRPLPTRTPVNMVSEPADTKTSGNKTVPDIQLGFADTKTSASVLNTASLAVRGSAMDARKSAMDTTVDVQSAGRLTVEKTASRLSTASLAARGSSIDERRSMMDTTELMDVKAEPEESERLVSSPSKVSTAPQKTALPVAPKSPNPNERYIMCEATMFHSGLSRLQNAEDVICDNIQKLRDMLMRLKTQQKLMAIYLNCMVDPDEQLLNSAQALRPRLRNIREACCPPLEASLTALNRHVNALVKPRTRPNVVGVKYDPLTCNAVTAFLFRPDSDRDNHKDGPMVTSLAVLDDNRLVMVDRNNKMVKVIDILYPHTLVQGIKLPALIYRLGLLRSGRVAVTGDKKQIFILDVTKSPTIVTKVNTRRQYLGLESTTQEDALIAACEKDMEGPARIDILTLAGVLVKTITDGSKLAGLKQPYNICVQDKYVWISEFSCSIIYQLDSTTGGVVKMLHHVDLDDPCQICLDKVGNCYIACLGSRCVMVATPAGHWRKLLGPEDINSAYVNPWAVCVTGWGVVVAWEVGGYSVISGHTLSDLN